MKKHIAEFFRRGLISFGFGPLVLAMLYMILQQQEKLHTLTVNQVSLGIVSLGILAFLAGGMNFIYQIERLPLMIAILIHGSVLYIAYLITYLVNGWLAWGITPILVFSGIFVLGYIVIWAIIFFIIRKNTRKINKILISKRQNTRKINKILISKRQNTTP